MNQWSFSFNESEWIMNEALINEGGKGWNYELLNVTTDFKRCNIYYNLEIK